MTRMYFPFGSILRVGSEFLIPHFSVVNLANATGFGCTCICNCGAVLYKRHPNILNSVNFKELDEN